MRHARLAGHMSTEKVATSTLQHTDVPLLPNGWHNIRFPLE